jgi:DNA-binding MarR family transcriptional regulator
VDENDVARLRAAVTRIARYLDRQSANEGLTRTETSSLGMVARHGSIRIGRLAELEGVNPTMQSRVVAKLEAAGYVTRSPDDEDRRVTHVSITPSGARLHARRRRERSALLAARLEQLPPGHAEQLLGSLGSLESLADALAPALSQQGAAGAGRTAR